MPLSRGLPTRSRSAFGVHGLLPVLLILLPGLLPGGSYASDEAFLYDPVLERKISRPVVTRGALDPRSDREAGAEGVDDAADIEEIRPVPTGCTYRDPELSISPSAPHWSSPDAPIEFSVIVTNTSSTYCNPTDFDLEATGPPGWDVSLDSETLQIAADWSTGIVTMVVTPPAPADNGTHDITITAGNERLSIEASATAAYVVEGGSTAPPVAPPEDAMPGTHEVAADTTDLHEADRGTAADTDFTTAQTCIPAAPGLVVLPANPPGSRDETPVYTIRLTNNDSPACADSTFDLSITYLPQGWSGTLSHRQMILSPGKPGVATLSITRATDTLTEKYTIRIGVSDRLRPEHSRTSTARHPPAKSGAALSSRPHRFLAFLF
ncbi:MAG: NEW3 domain-containing protein [Gammaproteobacteria bacterium]